MVLDMAEPSNVPERLGETVSQWLPPLKRAASPNPMMNASKKTKRFKCHPCNQGFTTKRALLRHTRESERHCAEHDVPRAQFACSQCTKRFPRSSGLERHVKEQHGNGKKPCPRCGKIVRFNAPHSNIDKEPCMAQMEMNDGQDDTHAAPKFARTSESIPCSQPSSGDVAELDFTTQLGLWAPEDAGTFLLSATLHRVPDEVYRIEDSWFRVEPTTSKIQFEIPDAVRKKEIRLATKRSMPCGICQREFEVHSKDALFKHLKDHLEDLSIPQHVCEICKIAFVNRKDLRRHRQSARTGHCGFNFIHKTPCTGHHPPPANSAFHTILTEWCTSEVSDDAENKDRDDFSRYIRSWELAQLQVYSRTTGDLLRAGLPNTKCHSAQLARSKYSRSIATLTYSDGATVGHRPGKRCLKLAEGRSILDETTHQEQQWPEWTFGGLGDADALSQFIWKQERQNKILRSAVLANDPDGVHKALANGAHVNQGNSGGETPLLLAFKRRAFEPAWTLLRRGAEMQVWLSEECCRSDNAATTCFKTSTCIASTVYHFLVEARKRPDHPQKEVGLLLGSIARHPSWVQWFFRKALGTTYRSNDNVKARTLPFTLRTLRDPLLIQTALGALEVGSAARAEDGEIFRLLAEHCNSHRHENHYGIGPIGADDELEWRQLWKGVPR